MCNNGEGPEKDSKQPETDFAEFYVGIISKLYDMKCRQISFDVRSALRDIRAMKSEENRNRKQYSYSYKTPPVKCAYLYGYSVLHSVMIYNEILKHLGRSRRYVMPALRTGSLKICCIGGGPGTEAVAICKAINDFLFKPNSRSAVPSLEVKATIVDKLPQWKREEDAVISAVNDESNILHSESLILHCEFLKADILKPFEKSLKEKIKEADIVTFIKVASYLQEDYQEDLQTMLRNVISCMDDNSCFFMLENSGGSIFYNLRSVLEEWSGLSLLKKSNHIGYSLDQKTVRRLSGLMRYNNDSKYQPILPTGLGKVSSCLWIKNMFPATENTEVPSKECCVSNGNSENSGSSSLQCDGNSVRDKSENDSKPECVVSSQAAVPKIRQKKKKLESKKQKQLKDTDVKKQKQPKDTDVKKQKQQKDPDVLIISKTPKRKNIKVPSDSKTENVVAPQVAIPKRTFKTTNYDSKKRVELGKANLGIERYINCKTKSKNSTIRDLVGVL